MQSLPGSFSSELANQPRLTAHIISHTHWDREWRWSVWQTRARLVETVDALLDLLEREPRYRHFTFDGQVVPIEDYLDFRPENTERVTRLVRAGRLSIGPWYTLPDLYPVDGECLVRNLLRGRRVAQQYGGCLDVGYTTFGWGQTAQFPQIYAGFGIEAIVTAKNVSRTRAPRSEFLWRAPDGTTVFTTRLGELGRANFYKRGILEITHDARFWTPEWEFPWSDAGQTVHRADADAFFTDYYRIQPKTPYHPERLREALERVWQTTDDSLSPMVRFFGDGCDYTGGLETLPRLIEEANAQDATRLLEHHSLSEYIAALRASIDPAALQVVEGELRDPPVTAVQGGALSTRLYIKQLNRRAQNHLIWLAEPLAACAAWIGAEYPRPFLDRAWRYLLLSHSHDAINGVTVDKISHDVVHRLQQVIELAGVVADNAMIAILNRVDLSRFAPGEVLLAVFNPLPRPRREVVWVSLDTPRNQDVERFAILNANGARMNVQFVDRQECLAPVHDVLARPRPFLCDRHSFFFDTGQLPACGYAIFRLIPETRQDRTLCFLQERLDQGSQLCAGGWGMENEFLKVVLNPDGSFDLTDKERELHYPGLNVFEDSGELGDYWHRTPPNHDQVVLSRGAPARLTIERDGPLVTTLCAELTLSIPARGDFARRRRSEQRIELSIRSEVTLRAGERRVEIKVRFDNIAEDHRLRVLFPTGIAATHSDAAGHFLVDQRPIALERDAQGLGPGGMKSLPMQSFVDISDGTRGLAFLNDGLTEYEVGEDPSRTLALTLLRTAPMMICTEFRTPTRYEHEKGGQCLGMREAAYAIYPHSGNWAAADVYGQAEQFNIPLRMLQTAPHPGDLPETQTFFSIQPAELRLSALKLAETGDRWIVRISNPTGDALMATLLLPNSAKEVQRVNLAEDIREVVEGGDTTQLTLLVGARHIETLAIRF